MKLHTPTMTWKSGPITVKRLGVRQKLWQTRWTTSKGFRGHAA
jgi:hypothetical protein